MTTVSIITVCFNSASTIRDTIESVLSQNFPSIEYIIVDGGSTDDTLSIVREYAGRIAKVISEPDRGIYDAMNKGINAATGDVVGILNSDDVYSSTASVKRLVERLERTGSDCVYADLVVVDRSNLSKVLRFFDSSAFRPGKLRFGWMPAHPTFMVNRSVYKTHGDYSLAFRIAADFEMMVRLFHVAKISFTHLPSVEILMRAGGTSMASWRSRWQLNREMVRACQMNGLYSNLPMILLKIPAKLLELVRRPEIHESGSGRQS